MPLRKDPLPRISGIMTFMRAPVGRLEDLKEGMVAVAGVTYDLSTTARIGSRFAPITIRETSGYYPYVGDKMVDLGNLRTTHLDWPKTSSELRQQMYEIARLGVTPVILGGDHFITCPLVQGFLDAVSERGGKKIGYIQFSSQLDLGEEDPLWGKVWRGATAKRILDSGAVAPSNMVWVGVNGYVPQDQMAMVDELDLNVFTLSDIRRDGIEPITERALDLAGEGCDAVYVSVDVNAVDGVLVPGVDTPSYRGVRNIDLLRAADILALSKAGALDLVGLNPLIESGGQNETGERFGSLLVNRFMTPRIKETA